MNRENSSFKVEKVDTVHANQVEIKGPWHDVMRRVYTLCGLFSPESQSINEENIRQTLSTLRKCQSHENKERLRNCHRQKEHEET